MKFLRQPAESPITLDSPDTHHNNRRFSRKPGVWLVPGSVESLPDGSSEESLTVISSVMPTYARAEEVFSHGEGAWLFDTEGRRYLDFGSGVAVTALGHAHPRLVKALTDQAARLWHISNHYRIVGQERVAALLVANTFAETVFFANSGVEAWECGAKMVRKYHHEQGHPERTRIITCAGGFHGRTFGAISATRQEKLTRGFEPLLEGFDVVAYNNVNELRAAITPETAGICVEPVQGEGGIRIPDARYLKELRAICDEFGLLLYLDEIQTGIGRTGKLFAHEWAGITPDVMCIAKGLGGGFPVGACLATARAAAGMTAGTHGSTFGGNPLAMAVTEAVLEEVLTPGFLEHVQAVGQTLRTRLDALAARFPTVFLEVRSCGLMAGLRCGPPCGELITASRKRGLLAIPAADNVLRLLPSLIIDDSHVAEAIACLEAVAAEVSGPAGTP